jgi:undecaprenyl-diphosphatase
VSGKASRLLSAALVLCASVGFAAFAASLHGAPGLPWDLAVTLAVQAPDSKLIDFALWPLDAVGFPPGPLIVYGAVIALMLKFGERLDALGTGLAAFGGWPLNYAIKALVERARPSPSLVHVDHRIAGFSFPAGHVLNFTAFAGFLSYLACERMAPSWRRSALVGFLLLLIVLMGIARIRAGEHWPSDVLGGYWAGLLWLGLVIALHRQARDRAARATRG